MKIATEDLMLALGIVAVAMVCWQMARGVSW